MMRMSFNCLATSDISTSSDLKINYAIKIEKLSSSSEEVSDHDNYTRSISVDRCRWCIVGFNLCFLSRISVVVVVVVVVLLLVV
jgi:uncharacterized protein YjaG (DUF416 family)